MRHCGRESLKDGARASALWGTGNRGGEHRSSALWGTGNRGGEHRSSALWNSGKSRGLVTTALALVALALPAGAIADGGGDAPRAWVAPGLLDRAARDPGATLDVIVESVEGSQRAADKAKGKGNGRVRRLLRSANAAAVSLPADRLDDLAEEPGLTITPDSTVRLLGYSSNDVWPYAFGFSKLWGGAAVPCATTALGVLKDPSCVPVPAAVTAAPAIAVVDSGIDASRLDFAGRVRAQVNLASLAPNSPGDGRGHGTFVAGVAAGAVSGFAGAAPSAPIVSLDVANDAGQARVSDVIAAADWILANTSSYNIRVANFSLGAAAGSIAHNPLNHAVERLWLAGVVVVASAGNYGVGGQATAVRAAPANDPFVITVGATDLAGSTARSDDTVAPWSVWGYTAEGFAKPDLSAGGRYTTGPVPMTSTLYAERPSKVVSPGYMRLSGTSFAAPVVAGAAAQLLARHPAWTPGMVKGALMVSAKPMPLVGTRAGGVGELDVVSAAALESAPNPNAGLNQFLRPDPAGGSVPVFDAAAWADAAWTDAAWNDAAWTDAAWTDAAWTDAAWADAAWTDAAWTDAAWAEAAWTDAAWTDGAAAE
jgi:serine protease AprX